MSNTLAVTEQNFQTEVLQSPIPVLVDFWAEWCGPCKALAPTLDEIATEYAGRLKVVKLDVDENQELAIQYDVRGIPTLMLFSGGRPVEHIVGAFPKPVIVKKLVGHLGESTGQAGSHLG
jgi:thioredoxin 1